MIRLEGEWDGIEGMGLAALQELRPRAEATVERVAMRFTNEVKETLTGARTGRVYRVPGTTNAVHVASAPGEPPAVLFGRLRQSIAWTPPVWEGWTVSSEVGTNVEYAQRLEYGGIDSRGVKIEARPYLAPTMLRMEPIADRMFEEGV